MEREKAVKYILNLVNNGIPIEEIYLEIFQAVQYEIGRLWQLNQLSIAQEHYATSVTQLAMSQLYPKIFTSFKKGKKATESNPKNYKISASHGAAEYSTPYEKSLDQLVNEADHEMYEEKKKIKSVENVR